MKTTFFELEDWEKKYLSEKALHLGEIEIIDGPLNDESEIANSDAEIISVFVDSRITEKTLAKFPNLKLITTRSTGYDHIDLEMCRSKGISVAYVPSYGEETVAEYTFALILTLSRKIFDSYDRIKETGSFSLAGMRGFDLNAKTIGVIGTGKIGKNVIEIARGFDMKVIAFDKFPDNTYAEKMQYEYLSLDEVLTQSDIITLHVPYTPENHHMINADSIAKMKKGVYLINTARGGLVDTSALLKGLKDGMIAGAALDVLEEEGMIKDELNILTNSEHANQHNLLTVLQNHALIDMPNVVITPHNAFNTWEALQRILDTTAQNISSFIKGEPANLVK